MWTNTGSLDLNRMGKIYIGSFWSVGDGFRLVKGHLAVSGDTFEIATREGEIRLAFTRRVTRGISDHPTWHKTVPYNRESLESSVNNGKIEKPWPSSDFKNGNH